MEGFQDWPGDEWTQEGDKFGQVDLKKLGHTPLRHDGLSDDLLARIRAVWTVINPHCRFHIKNLEDFEVGFMRDTNPEREIAVFESIASCITTYAERYKPSKSKLGRVYSDALILTVGGKPEQGKAEARKIRECFPDGNGFVPMVISRS